MPALMLQVFAAEGSGGNLGDLLIPLVIVFLIFYFLVIRPAGRERRSREDQVRNLKKHDRVVTNAGIHGTIVAIEDETVTLRVDDKNNVRIRFSRTAIWQVNPQATAAPGAESGRKAAAGAKP
jgi:preprotein translocase subunit YajC